jgi:hypothetical protein
VCRRAGRDRPRRPPAPARPGETTRCECGQDSAGRSPASKNWLEPVKSEMGKGRRGGQGYFSSHRRVQQGLKKIYARARVIQHHCKRPHTGRQASASQCAGAEAA